MGTAGALVSERARCFFVAEPGCGRYGASARVQILHAQAGVTGSDSGGSGELLALNIFFTGWNFLCEEQPGAFRT